MERLKILDGIIKEQFYDLEMELHRKYNIN